MWVKRAFAALLAGTIAIILAVWVEELLSGYGRIPPLRASGYAVRILACLVGSVFGSLVVERNSVAFLLAVVGFYIWSDHSGVFNYGRIDGHPADWYPLSFPSGDVVWQITLFLFTVTGLILGRLLGAAFKSQLQLRSKALEGR
jgi:hypothetical protein